VFIALAFHPTDLGPARIKTLTIGWALAVKNYVSGFSQTGVYQKMTHFVLTNRVRNTT
jgi:hypothetical protein